MARASTCYSVVMAIDDLWYLSRRGEDGKPVPSSRHGRGKRWRVRVPGHPTEAFQKLKGPGGAEAREIELKNANLTGTALDAHRSKMRLTDYSAIWRESQVHRESTRSVVETAFRLHITPTLGDLRMDQIRLSNLQRLVSTLSDSLAPQSVHNIWQHLHSMLLFAVADRALGLDPGQGIKLPELDRRLKNVPTTNDVQRLIKAADGPFRAVFYLAAGCGLRGGELFGLEPDCIDFDRQKLIVRQQVRKVSTAAAYIGPPKTLSSYREVDLPAVVAEELSKLTPTKHLMWDHTDKQRPVQRDVSLYFETARTRRPFTTGAWDNLVKATAARAGLEGISLHGLRHYFATYLILHGADVKRVQRALGHAKATVTLDTYAGYWPDLETDSAVLLDQALRSG